LLVVIGAKCDATHRQIHLAIAGGIGRAHSNGVHTEHGGTLGAGRADGTNGESTGARRHVEADVHVGGRHLDNVSRADDREDSMMVRHCT
jgi:hypothetical protein